MKTVGTVTFSSPGTIFLPIGFEPTYIKATVAGPTTGFVTAIRYSEGIWTPTYQGVQKLYQGSAGLRTEKVDGKIVSLPGNVSGDIGESLALEVTSVTSTGVNFNVSKENATVQVVFEFED